MTPEKAKKVLDALLLALERTDRTYGITRAQYAEAIAIMREEVAQPDGWMLVPMEPTLEMCRAGDDCDDADPRMDDSPSYYQYKAMLAAAPGAPQAPAEPPKEISDAEILDLWEYELDEASDVLRFARALLERTK